MRSINDATPAEWDHSARNWLDRDRSPQEGTQPASKADRQPAPTANNHPAVWPLVMVDMATRDKVGRERYGVPLQPFNGRDTLRDAYEEALDLAVYLRSIIYERDKK